MIDSYGDGWNDVVNTLTDDVKGLVGTGTLSTGSRARTVTVYQTVVILLQLQEVVILRKFLVGRC